jgi:hypothetical protein
MRAICASRGEPAVRGAPRDRERGRPSGADVQLGDRHRRGDGDVRLRGAGENGIGALERVRDIEDVADAQIRRLQDGGQHIVERGVGEVGLPARHGEFLTRCEHVDRLVTAKDPHVVHDDRVGVGIPCQGERADLGKSLRRLNPEGALDVHLHRAGSELELPVDEQDPDGSVRGGHRDGQRDGFHPGRGRGEFEATRRARGGSPGEREETRDDAAHRYLLPVCCFSTGTGHPRSAAGLASDPTAEYHWPPPECRPWAPPPGSSSAAAWGGDLCTCGRSCQNLPPCGRAAASHPGVES